jgi:hypothetical protein
VGDGGSLFPKICTEAGNRPNKALKPAHTVGCSRSCPKYRYQRSPSFARPASAAPPYSHLGVTSFCSERQARANRLQLPKATFQVVLPREPPSSQLPSLPKFNFGAALPVPTKCTVTNLNYRDSVLLNLIQCGYHLPLHFKLYTASQSGLGSF